MFWYTLSCSRLDILGYNVMGMIVLLSSIDSPPFFSTSGIICDKGKWLKPEYTISSELIVDFISLLTFESLWYSNLILYSSFRYSCLV